MLLTDRSQVPLLLIVNGKSLNEPTQTLPKLPLSAMTVAIAGTPPVPVAKTSKLGADGSLLAIRIWAVCDPGDVGLNLTVKSTSAFGLIIKGGEGLGSTVKSVEPKMRWTLLTVRFCVPTLKTCIVRFPGAPEHTLPKSNPFCVFMAMAGPEGALNSNAPRPKVAARSTPACVFIA